MKFIKSLSLLMLTWLPFAANASVQSDYRILVYGDSLSAGYGISMEQGWVHLLRQRVAPKGIEVINASVSGETTSGGLTRISQALEHHQPQLLILELGANDGLRGLDLNVSRENLDDMISQARQREIQVLLLGMQIPPNYGRRYTEQFETMFAELSNEHGVALVDFFLEPVASSFDFMQADGIHPTAEAQPLLLDHVWPALSALLPQL